MERDLQFLKFLTGAPVYKERHPNLFERLQQFGQQADEMEQALRALEPDQQDALLEFENRLNIWKAGIYEFLESSI